MVSFWVKHHLVVSTAVSKNSKNRKRFIAPFWGDKLVADLDDAHKKSEGDNRPWTIYAGDWSRLKIAIAGDFLIDGFHGATRELWWAVAVHIPQELVRVWQPHRIAG